MSSVGPLALTISGPIAGHVLQARASGRTSQVLRHEFVPDWSRGQIGLVTVEVDSLEQLSSLLADIRGCEDVLELIKPAELEDAFSARQRRQIGLVLAPSSLAITDLDELYLWREIGAQVFCLAYNLRNLFADGVGEARDGGLSQRGRALVACLHDLDYLIDVSHLSDNSIADVLEVTSGPLMASHSCSRSLCENARNITDEQAIEIARRGGIVAPSVHPSLLSAVEPSFQTYLRHLYYLIELLGPRGVGIGADFVYYSADVVKKKLAESDPGGKIYYSDEVSCSGLRTYADLGPIAGNLFSSGLSSGDVSAITAENYWRVLKMKAGASHEVAAKNEGEPLSDGDIGAASRF